MVEKFQASVIIPTYNRSYFLSVCLAAVAAQNTDASVYEIVVVDNNSTDDTAAVVQKFSETHPNIRLNYAIETKQGVSNARNRALIEARGDILCFLDDDSPPAADWLNILLCAFDDPQVGCVGGPSILDYQGQERPAWLYGDLQGLISSYGLPFTKPTPLTKWEQFPLSCNMGIRKKIFDQVNSFRPDLGRLGKVKLTGAETDLANRIYKAGWKVLYLPDACVRHFVTPERLQKSYIYKIGYGLAASHVILTLSRRPFSILHCFASDAWFAFRRLLWLALSLIKGDPLWFDNYMRFWMVFQRLPIRVQVLLKNPAFKRLEA